MICVYPALRINENETILIVAPHPDDETIGCGGILSLYGPQCDVLLLTDGRLGIPEGSELTQDETASIRKIEFISVMNYFGVREFKTLDIPDAELAENGRLIKKCDIGTYDKVFVPNRNERHPDHKAAFKIINSMCRKQKTKPELIEYEVWSPITSANLFLDVSSVMEEKVAGLQKYASQTASIDYSSFVRGLNMYRGAPHHVKYCEAYYAGSNRRNGAVRMIARILSKCFPHARSK